MTCRAVSPLVIVSAVVCLAATPLPQESRARTDHTDTIRRMLMELHENGEFTGSVLVARAGSVVYRDAIASTADEARSLLMRPSNIGSVAKKRMAHSRPASGGIP